MSTVEARRSLSGSGKQDPHGAFIIRNFKKLSANEVEEDKKTQTWGMRLRNRFAKLIGLSVPLNRDYYEAALKKCDGKKEEVISMVMSKPWDWSFKIIGMDKNFDIYQATKNGHGIAITLLICVYFLSITLFFGYLAKAGDCIATNNADFLPKSFMLISGLGKGLDTDEDSVYCFWIESFALLIGVYFSLPAFGAIVLVRLLDNNQHVIILSDNMILTKRAGVPVMMLRMMNSTGLLYYNVNLTMSFGITQPKDEETGESYLVFVKIQDPLNVYEVSGIPLNVSIPLPADHVLRKMGAVLLDEETGIPTWNRKIVVSCRCWASAESEQGGRTTITPKSIMGRHFVDANKKGQLPLWDACLVNSIFDWAATGGEKKPEVNALKLGSYSYHDTPHSRELARLNAKMETTGAAAAEAAEPSDGEDDEKDAVGRNVDFTNNSAQQNSEEDTDPMLAINDFTNNAAQKNSEEDTDPLVANNV